MGWLIIDVKIRRKKDGNRFRWQTTNLPVNMSIYNTEELEYFILRVKDHLVKKRKYKSENISFSVA